MLGLVKRRWRRRDDLRVTKVNCGSTWPDGARPSRFFRRLPESCRRRPCGGRRLRHGSGAWIVHKMCMRCACLPDIARGGFSSENPRLAPPRQPRLTGARVQPDAVARGQRRPGARRSRSAPGPAPIRRKRAPAHSRRSPRPAHRSRCASRSRPTSRTCCRAAARRPQPPGPGRPAHHGAHDPSLPPAAARCPGRGPRLRRRRVPPPAGIRSRGGGRQPARSPRRGRNLGVPVTHHLTVPAAELGQAANPGAAPPARPAERPVRAMQAAAPVAHQQPALRHGVQAAVRGRAVLQWRGPRQRSRPSG